MEQLKTQHITPSCMPRSEVRSAACWKDRQTSACGQLPRRVTKRYPAGDFRKGDHGKTAIILAEDETNSPEQDTLTAYRLEHRSTKSNSAGIVAEGRVSEAVTVAPFVNHVSIRTFMGKAISRSKQGPRLFLRGVMRKGDHAIGTNTVRGGTEVLRAVRDVRVAMR